MLVMHPCLQMHAMSALLIENLEAVSKHQRMVCCFVQEHSHLLFNMLYTLMYPPVKLIHAVLLPNSRKLLLCNLPVCPSFA